MTVAADSNFTPSVGVFSLTNGGTAQLMLAGNQRRQSLYVYAVTETTIINFGATAGAQAAGTLTAGSQPAAGDTIAVNGVTFTFVAGASTATNVHIGAAKEDTMTNFQAVLAASANASIILATYSVSGAIVTITSVAGGTDGNAYTLANSNNLGAVTRSAATLTGGSNTAGGWTLLTTTPGTVFNAAQFPSIKNDIYVVSPTNAAFTNYLEGFG